MKQHDTSHMDIQKLELNNKIIDMKYEVGQPFPDQRYVQRDAAIAIFTESFVNITITMESLSRSEIEAFKSRSFTIALYKSQNIPFIAMQFQEFSIDASLDITLLTAEQQENWLNQNANVMNIFLIEATSGILTAIRTVGVNFREELKDILEEQTAETNIDPAIDNIRNRVTTEEMLVRAVKRQKF